MINADDCSVLLNDISEYAEIDEKKVVATILKSSIAFFLDTCFITRLRLLKEDKRYSYFSKFVDEGEDICFVITGMVLYELKDSQEDKLQKDNFAVIRELNRQGFKIVILLEEKVVGCLKDYIGYSATEWKRIFDETISNNKPIFRKTSSVLATDKELFQYRKCGINYEFIEKMYFGIKRRKESKDSLADELIMICFMLFLELPGRTKYCYCTTDYSAIVNLNKLIDSSSRIYSDRIERLDFFCLIKELYLKDDLTVDDQKWIVTFMNNCFGEKVYITQTRGDGFVPVTEIITVESLVERFEAKIDVRFYGYADK